MFCCKFGGSQDCKFLKDRLGVNMEGPYLRIPWLWSFWVHLWGSQLLESSTAEAMAVDIVGAPEPPEYSYLAPLSPNKHGPSLSELLLLEYHSGTI